MTLHQPFYYLDIQNFMELTTIIATLTGAIILTTILFYILGRRGQ